LHGVGPRFVPLNILRPTPSPRDRSACANQGRGYECAEPMVQWVNLFFFFPFEERWADPQLKTRLAFDKAPFSVALSGYDVSSSGRGFWHFFSFVFLVCQVCVRHTKCFLSGLSFGEGVTCVRPCSLLLAAMACLFPPIMTFFRWPQTLKPWS